MYVFTLKGAVRICALIICFILQGTPALFAQNSIDISGRVIGKDDGLPIPGVSVTVKGGTTGSSTDRDGKFVLKAEKGAILVISSIGYTSQQLPAAAVMNISLVPESSDLEEVTIVGVTVKKKDLTGAVAGITAKTISELPVTNVNQAIQGRVPGVLVLNSDPKPGGDATIKIRGSNSIKFGAKPIYVVDGLVMEDGFNVLNPDDVASMDVLRDASATAIYGSRGANGVIVVTTKKAKNGEGKIEYNAWVGVQSFTKNIPYLNAQQIVSLRQDAFANKYIDNNPGANREDYINTLMGPGSPAFGQSELDVYRSGQSYNWLDQITRTGVQQNHTASFSKGSETGSAYVSFNYTDQAGLLKESNYSRYGGQINLDQKIKPWLKIGTNTNFTRTESSYIDGGVFNIAANANPLIPINSDDIYLGWKGIQSTDLYNPIRSLRIDGKENQTRLLTTNYVSANPIAGLTIRTGFSVDYRTKNYYNYIPRDLGQSIRSSSGGKATQNKDEWVNWQWDSSVAYDKTVGKHSFSGLLAVGLTENNHNYNNIQAAGFPSDDFSYKNIGAASQRDQFVLSSDFISNSLISYTGRINYNYDGKYFATVTSRYDGSSKFGTNNKWGLFPSLALAWDIAKEDFMEGSKLDALKLRTGYGIAGNQNIPEFAYRTLYRPGYSNNAPYFKKDDRLGNPDLRWEKQKQLNLGLDAAVLNNRLSFSVDYFIIHNDDLLLERGLQPSGGYLTSISNVGSLLNKGIEFQVNAAIIKQDDLQWNLSANISSYKNKITKLYGRTPAIYSYGGYSNVDIQREGNLFLGQPLDNIYTYKFEKIAQQSDMDRIKNIDYGGRVVRPGDIIPTDINGDGKIDDADRVIVGKKDPKFYGGFASNVTYKNFSLNTVFNYSYGGKAINYLYEGLMGGTGEYAGHTDELNRWTPTNTNTNIPRAYQGSGRYSLGETDYAVQSTSYLRMSALTFAYNFGSEFLKKAKMGNLRLYLTGSNLFTVTKYKGYDPEGGDGYPTSRTFVAGVNVGF